MSSWVYTAVYWKRQQEEVKADICYLCPYHPVDNTKSNSHETDAQSLCSSKHHSFSLSLYLSFSLFFPSPALTWKGRENQGQATKHVKLQENKFPHTCPFRPTDRLKECSLVKPGNIWLVKTYGMFTWGPFVTIYLPFPVSFLPPLTRDTQIHIGNDGWVGA